MMAALLGLAAQPVAAARLDGRDGAAERELGAFAGARLRVPLGGDARARPSAGLTLAPALRGRDAYGDARLQVGEGVGFGLRGDGGAGLSIAGRPALMLLRPAGNAPRGKAGVSTLGWVGIGAAVLVTGAVGFFAWALDEAEDAERDN